MEFTQAELVDISSNAMVFNELKHNIPYDVYNKQLISQSNSVIDWIKIVANGNINNFSKRLEWSNIKPDQLERFFDSKEGYNNKQLPSWIITLNDCLKNIPLSLSQTNNNYNDLLGEKESPQPFEEIFIPFILNGRNKLRKRLNDKYDLLSTAAHIQLEKSLLAWLCYINSFTMELEFSTYRSWNQSIIKSKLSNTDPSSSKTNYNDFILRMLNGEIIEYYKEYSMLAKFTGLAIEQWIESVKEFIERYEKDKKQIEKIFNNKQEIGRIIETSASLSDRHNGGRSVITVVCESGLKLVYKPKNLGIEKAYVGLLKLLHAYDSPIKFKLFKIIAHEDYGWMEFIEEIYPENELQANKYHKNAGGLLCITHMLGATDLHYENIIMSNEDPVLIDLETLLHPVASEESILNGTDALTQAENVLNNSAIRTGLLPRWIVDTEEQVYDVSGFGKYIPQQYNITRPQWVHVNTDFMKIVKKEIEIKSHKVIKYDALSVEGFSEQIITGFEEMYNFLLRKKKNILNSPNWKRLSNQKIRFVFRATKIYSTLLQNLLNPKLLRSGMIWSSHLDILYQGIVNYESKPFWWPLIEEEQRTLEQLDIPHFTASTGADFIQLNKTHKIEKYFNESSFQCATNKLKKSCKKDLLLQTELIRGSFQSRFAEKSYINPNIKHSINKQQKSYKLNQKIAIRTCISIAYHLKSKGITANDGSITWISQKFNSKTKKYQLEPISNDIYSGGSGIGLFFAALFKTTQKKEFRKLAIGSVNIALKQVQIKKNFIDENDALPTGGIVGYGSLIYAFLNIGLLCNEPALTDAAADVAKLVSKQLIERDKCYDVMHGSAGLILALVNLYKYKKEPYIVELINCAAEYLLNCREITASGHKVWPFNEGVFLTGFSHGAAGIAYSLIQAYKVTNNSLYKDAALGAIAYETSVFDTSENNWPDFRKPVDKIELGLEESKFMCTWCHGATGIGLARVGILDALDEKSILADINNAIKITKEHLNSPMDHLCCGNFGRLELLLTASQKLSDNSLYTLALEQAGQITYLAQRSGSFRYNPHLGYTPGFFQGISGIGYQLLRLTSPESIPSVLMLS
ncbi:type 2 lanthipeptide synthetase LanM family protein [Spirosoma sp. KNUC1025]|uniref:type 2 lanthipeptide synthetase LanM family protein n=1 Tax=Spirosoma sp. KNUC1025 TaxID=2894082 RepID=UPI00386FB3FF|nr:type 2 lantipeptide synthetase LanM family protein [Spirosoma sp. KNUC1025]